MSIFLSQSSHQRRSRSGLRLKNLLKDCFINSSPKLKSYFNALGSYKVGSTSGILEFYEILFHDVLDMVFEGWVGGGVFWLAMTLVPCSMLSAPCIIASHVIGNLKRDSRQVGVSIDTSKS